MVRPSRFASLLLSLGLAASLLACKENGNDYLDEGLRLLGEAERGDCKAGWDPAKKQNTIDSRRIAVCLDKTKAALEPLHKARELGVNTRELNDLIDKTEAEVAKLESMLKIVGRIQHEKRLQ
jgi:hypothetical protein